jgi:hypothetical protein
MDIRTKHPAIPSISMSITAGLQDMRKKFHNADTQAVAHHKLEEMLE